MEMAMAEVPTSEAAETKRPASSGIRYGEFKADIVWKNAIGIALLHLFAIYGASRVFEMKALTLVWSYLYYYFSGQVGMRFT